MISSMEECLLYVSRQVNVRLVGAMITLQRNNVFKKIKRIKNACNGVVVLLSATQIESHKILKEDLIAINR